MHQLELKKSVFLDGCQRLGGFDATIDSFVHREPWSYRNKAQLPVQNEDSMKVGYFRSRSHVVVDHDACPISCEMINQALPIIKARIKKSGIKIYNELTHQGNLRHVVIRASRETGQLHLTFVTSQKQLPDAIHVDLAGEIKDLTGVSLNHNPYKTNRILGNANYTIWGRGYWEEKIGSRIFRISPSSFFQVNTQVLEAIEETMIELGKPQGNEVLLDLYAGIGTFGIMLADKVASVMSFEENSRAAYDGLENSRLNSINNIQFIKGKVEDCLPLAKKADLVILDPPRQGILPEVIEYLARLKPAKIIYLSCDPATFARDVKRFGEKGYRLNKCHLFDLFPQTYHFEILSVLVR